MRENLNHGLWARTAANTPNLQPLTSHEKAEVVIIGGGYTGLSAALHSAELGIKTLLLEANNIGFGASGRNVGLVNAGLWIKPEQLLKVVGPKYGQQLLDDLSESPQLVFDIIQRHGFDCEAVRNGTLHCAHSKSGFRELTQRYYQWQNQGVEVDLLDAKQTYLRTGSRAFHGALWDSRAGTIQPLSYAYGLATSASQLGARLCTYSPVMKITRFGDKWQVMTPRGRVEANFVLVCTNEYASHGLSALRNHHTPMHYFQFATSPLECEEIKTILPHGEGAWDTHKILTSFRRDSHNRLIIGSVGNLNHIAFSLHKKWAKKTIKRLFPQLTSFDIESAWSGRFAMTNNSVPYVRILGDNYLSISGYNGRGIGTGTYFGKKMAEFVANNDLNAIPLKKEIASAQALRLPKTFLYETAAALYHLW